mmetsp:Transcript_86157/g.164800  ORF Transcript_86157/g.164800 Transcript_86157/m.164800 type:complete len:119 (-) Transcript_86157:488-844(-)
MSYTRTGNFCHAEVPDCRSGALLGSTDCRRGGPTKVIPLGAAVRLVRVLCELGFLAGPAAGADELPRVETDALGPDGLTPGAPGADPAVGMAATLLLAVAPADEKPMLVVWLRDGDTP